VSGWRYFRPREQVHAVQFTAETATEVRDMILRARYEAELIGDYLAIGYGAPDRLVRHGEWVVFDWDGSFRRIVPDETMRADYEETEAPAETGCPWCEA